MSYSRLMVLRITQWIKVSSKKLGTLLCGCIYRSPSAILAHMVNNKFVGRRTARICACKELYNLIAIMP